MKNIKKIGSAVWLIRVFIGLVLMMGLRSDAMWTPGKTGGRKPTKRKPSATATLPEPAIILPEPAIILPESAIILPESPKVWIKTVDGEARWLNENEFKNFNTIVESDLYFPLVTGIEKSEKNPNETIWATESDLMILQMINEFQEDNDTAGLENFKASLSENERDKIYGKKLSIDIIRNKNIFVPIVYIKQDALSGFYAGESALKDAFAQVKAHNLRLLFAALAAIENNNFDTFYGKLSDDLRTELSEIVSILQNVMNLDSLVEKLAEIRNLRKITVTPEAGVFIEQPAITLAESEGASNPLIRRPMGQVGRKLPSSLKKSLKQSIASVDPTNTSTVYHVIINQLKEDEVAIDTLSPKLAETYNEIYLLAE